jgi:cytochrome c oxidase subunit 2
MFNWLPQNVSSYGHEMDHLMWLIYYVVGAWFLVAEGLVFYFIFRYRNKPGVGAAYATGRGLKAASWVLIPAALVLICDLAIDAKAESVWHHIKQEIPTPDVQVRVEARQFAWTFRHAGPDGKFDTADDIVTNGELHVPVGKVVRFELTSKDVIHSFWLPNLRLKQDVVPGRMIPGWFKVEQVGTYGIGCAQICGNGHTVMGATLVVHSEEDYREWLKK